MSSQQPPPALPKEIPPQARTAVALVYGSAFLAMAIMAIYMLMGQRMPLASAQVALPAAGALWFLLRLFMTLRRRPQA